MSRSPPTLQDDLCLLLSTKEFYTLVPAGTPLNEKPNAKGDEKNYFVHRAFTVTNAFEGQRQLVLWFATRHASDSATSKHTPLYHFRKRMIIRGLPVTEHGGVRLLVTISFPWCDGQVDFERPGCVELSWNTNDTVMNGCDWELVSFPVGIDNAEPVVLPKLHERVYVVDVERIDIGEAHPIWENLGKEDKEEEWKEDFEVVWDTLKTVVQGLNAMEERLWEWDQALGCLDQRITYPTGTVRAVREVLEHYKKFLKNVDAPLKNATKKLPRGHPHREEVKSMHHHIRDVDDRVSELERRLCPSGLYPMIGRRDGSSSPPSQGILLPLDAYQLNDRGRRLLREPKRTFGEASSGSKASGGGGGGSADTEHADKKARTN